MHYGWLSPHPSLPAPTCRLGISKIYVFDNGSDPPLQSMLQAYIDKVGFEGELGLGMPERNTQFLECSIHWVPHSYPV